MRYVIVKMHRIENHFERMLSIQKFSNVRKTLFLRGISLIVYNSCFNYVFETFRLDMIVKYSQLNIIIHTFFIVSLKMINMIPQMTE